MEILGQEKTILDATAGYRMMWFNKNHPNTLYIDQRPECEPDQIVDWGKKLPYPDDSFSLVVFDPPHIIRKKTDGGSVMLNEYGVLKAESWQHDFKNAFTEFFRVLKPNGILLFKWANTNIQAHEILKLAPCDPLFYQVSKVDKDKKGQHFLKTLWFCFMKETKQ